MFSDRRTDAQGMRTARLATAGLGLALVLGTAACGGSGSTGTAGTTATTTPAPGANVNPNASGYVNTPVNKARTAVTNLNQYQHQEEQQTGG
jgi:hypothetical protein